MAIRREALRNRRTALGFTQEELAQAVGTEVSTVRRWEAGTSVPQPWTQPRIARALKVNPDQLQELLEAGEQALRREPKPPVTSTVSTQIPHPTGIVTNLSDHLDTELFIPGQRSAASIPHRLSTIDAQQLNTLVNQFEQLDHAAGGRAAARSMALTHFGFALDCLKSASMSPSVRHQWMQVAGRLGRLCGFASADAADHPLARKAFATALNIANEAGDHHNRLNILCGLTRQAVQLGDRDTAAHLLAELQAKESGQSGLEKCMLYAVEARVHGLLGHERHTLLAISLAEEEFTQDRTGDEPPWLWYYDEAQMFGDTAHAQFPLAMDGHQVDAASSRFVRAIELHRPTNARSRAFSAAKLAILAVRWGQESALDLTDRAIAAASVVQSARADSDLRLLAEQLDRVDSPRAREQLAAIMQVLAQRELATEPLPRQVAIYQAGDTMSGLRGRSLRFGGVLDEPRSHPQLTNPP